MINPNVTTLIAGPSWSGRTSAALAVAVSLERPFLFASGGLTPHGIRSRLDKAGTDREKMMTIDSPPMTPSELERFAKGRYLIIDDQLAFVEPDATGDKPDPWRHVLKFCSEEGQGALVTLQTPAGSHGSHDGGKHFYLKEAANFEIEASLLVGSYAAKLPESFKTAEPKARLGFSDIWIFDRPLHLVCVHGTCEGQTWSVPVY